jgi:hypothetical protein
MELAEKQKQLLETLDQLHSEMVKSGFVIVSCAAIYVAAADSVQPGAWFHTRLAGAVTHGVPIDHAVLDALREITTLWRFPGSPVCDDTAANLTTLQVTLLKDLHDLQTSMTRAGFVVVSCAALYEGRLNWPSAGRGPRPIHYSTRLSGAETNGMEVDHAVLDALREITTQWSESAHV